MTQENPFMRSSYLKNAMDSKQLPTLIRQLKKNIHESGVEFNAIAFRGMSGALVAPLLALRMKKGLIVCRKSSEQAHAGPVEGHLQGGGYIIVDDFKASGRTICSIDKVIQDWWARECIAQVFDTKSGISYWRDKTEEEKLPPFMCQGVFLYQTYTQEILTLASGYEIKLYGTLQ